MLFIYMSFDHIFFGKYKQESRNDRIDRCLQYVYIELTERGTYHSSIGDANKKFRIQYLCSLKGVGG
jgi:hypothetical protein